MLVLVKPAVRFYKGFIINGYGGGVYTIGEIITRMNKNRMGRVEFTTLLGRSNTGHAVFQRILNYDWVRGRVIWKGWDVHSMNGMEWMISVIPHDNKDSK